MYPLFLILRKPFSPQHHNFLPTVMILIAYSEKDTAGTNIAKKVMENCKFNKATEIFQDNPVFAAKINERPVKIVTLREETIYAQNLPDQFSDLDLVVFLSRHSSASGTPTLSVHAPGNFSAAELGGLPQTLSVCPAESMCTALKTLDDLRREMQLDYEVSYECTHHGPSLSVPTMFVELGSSPAQWSDLKASEAVAKAAMAAICNFGFSSRNAVLGIGGPHYNKRFTEMALKGKARFGHMIPKYAIHSVTVDLLRQSMEKTVEKVNLAILDWKGIRGLDKAHILRALKEVDLPYKKV